SRLTGAGPRGQPTDRPSLVVTPEPRQRLDRLNELADERLSGRRFVVDEHEVRDVRIPATGRLVLLYVRKISAASAAPDRLGGDEARDPGGGPHRDPRTWPIRRRPGDSVSPAARSEESAASRPPGAHGDARCASRGGRASETAWRN